MKTIIFWVLLVTGTTSVSVSEAHQIIRLAQEHFSEIGIRLKVQHIRPFPVRGVEIQGHWFSNFFIPDSVNPSGYQWYAFTEIYNRVQAWKKNKHINLYVMLPPYVTSDGTRLIGGESWENSYCNGAGFSVGNAEIKNQAGIDRIGASSYIMEHEILHELGATHDDSSTNVMNTTFNSPNSDIRHLVVNQKALNQICWGKLK